MSPPATTKLWLTTQTAMAPAVWGSTYLVTTELLPSDRPLLAGTLRALPAGLLLLAVAPTLPIGSWWWRALALGTLNIGAFFALLFVAAYRLPGGIAATLGAVQPLAVALLAVALLDQRLSLHRLLAGGAAVAGVGLLVLRGEAALDPIGVLAGLLGTASMALGVVLTQRWGRPVSLLAFTGWQLTAGGLVLAPLTLAAEGLPSTLTHTNLLGYAYLALIGTALAYMLWFRGIGRLTAPAVSFLGLLSPLVAAVLGAAVLSQTLTPWQTLGFALALASVIVGQLDGRLRPSLTPRRTRALLEAAACARLASARRVERVPEGAAARDRS